MMSKNTFAIPAGHPTGKMYLAEPANIAHISIVLGTLLIIMIIITLMETIRLIIRKKTGYEVEKTSRLKKRTIIFAVITAVLILINIFFEGIGKELLINSGILE